MRFPLGVPREAAGETGCGALSLPIRCVGSARLTTVESEPQERPQRTGQAPRLGGGQPCPEGARGCLAGCPHLCTAVGGDPGSKLRGRQESRNRRGQEWKIQKSGRVSAAKVWEPAGGDLGSLRAVLLPSLQSAPGAPGQE